MKENQITVQRTYYAEKFGGDDRYAEIYKGAKMVGQVFRNGYLNEVRGVDLRLSESDPNNPRAYFHPDNRSTFEEQIASAIYNIIFLIAGNEALVHE